MNPILTQTSGGTAGFAPSAPDYRFAFVMDQQVGLRTQALNLERVLTEDPTVAPTFVPVAYAAPNAGLLSRLPMIPSGMRGTLRGIREIRDGLGTAHHFDAIFWASWAAKSVPDLVEAAPAFLRMDMTPNQMEAMGDAYGYSRSRSRFLGGWKRRATERIYQEAIHLFPWSEWVAASLRDDWDVAAEKITPVSPGVDTDLYCPDPAERPVDRERPLRLLFVGGDFRRKGGDLLLRWMNERGAAGIAGRKATLPAVELHLVTRDEVPPTPGVVVYRGVPNNSQALVRLYQRSDLFVLPTRADCYSLVALEAMACGLPVIISSLGGIPEIVLDGKTGLLIPPDDYGALTTALERLLPDMNLLRRMGLAARQRARTHFDCRRNLAIILDYMKTEVNAV